MKIINLVKKFITKRHKTQQKTEAQEDIETFIQSEKIKNGIDYMMALEKQNFLYGRGNNLQNEQ